MIYKKITSCIIMTCFVNYSFEAIAEPLSTYVKKGSQVPFDGMLLNDDSILELNRQKIQEEYDKKRCELDKKDIKESLQSVCNFEKKQLQLNIEFMQKKYDSIIKIKDEENKKVLEIAKKSNGNTTLWFTIGVISGLAGGFLLVYATSKLK